MRTYVFNDHADIVAYFRSRAAENNSRAAQFSVRTHQYTEHITRANVYREIADMVARSNIGIDLSQELGAGGIK